MRKLVAGILTVAGLALGAQAAIAADMNRAVRKAPAPAVVAAYNWSGFYLGGHLGYAWSSDKVTDTNGTSLYPDPDGFLGGVQAGYNWQFDRWVLGIEGDWSWSDADGSATDNTLVVLEGKHKWYATLTGRAGYAWDNWLWYVKGGAAWADTEYSIVSMIGGDYTRSGWTVGGGVEWGFAPQWSTKLEYNYLDFGKEDYFEGLDGDTQVHLVKLGVNYRF
jgi:outer membrane immunogenic protein